MHHAPPHPPQPAPGLPVAMTPSTPPQSPSQPGSPAAKLSPCAPDRAYKRARLSPASDSRTDAGSESPTSHSHVRRRAAAKSPDALFFDAHSHEEWFRERYHPDYVAARSRRIGAEVRSRAREFTAFMRGARDGVPRLSYSSVLPEAFSSADDIWDDETYGQHMSQRLGADEPVLGAKGKSGDGDCLPSRRRYRRDTVFLRNVPPDVGREALTAVLRFGARGAEDLGLVRLKIGEMSAKLHHPRTAWAVFRDEKAARHACAVLQGVVVRATRRRGEEQAAGLMDYKMCCQLNEDRRKRLSPPRLMPYIFGTADRMNHDFKGSLNVMRFLDRLRNVDPKDNPLTFAFLNSLDCDDRRLDHVLTYLVEVHAYCYYNGVEFLEDVCRTRESTLRPRVNRFKHLTAEDVEAATRVDEKTAEILRRKYDQPRHGARHADFETSRCVREWVRAHAVGVCGGYECDLVTGNGRRRLFENLDSLRDFMVFEFRDAYREIVDRVVDDGFRKNFDYDPGQWETIAAYNAGIPR